MATNCKEKLRRKNETPQWLFPGRAKDLSCPFCLRFGHHQFDAANSVGQEWIDGDTIFVLQVTVNKLFLKPSQCNMCGNIIVEGTKKNKPHSTTVKKIQNILIEENSADRTPIIKRLTILLAGFEK